MTLMFIDGFMRNKTNRYRWWNYSITYPVRTSSGAFHPEPTMDRVLYFGDDNTARIASHQLPDIYEEVFCGFRFRLPTSNLESHSVASWRNRNGDRHCSIHAIWNAAGYYHWTIRDSSSNVEIGAGGDTAKWFPGRWYYVEWKVLFSQGTGGSTSMRIDGRSIGEWTGIDTMVGTAPQYAAQLQLGANTGKWGNIGARYDDVYIANASGTENTDFLGPIYVEQSIPIGDGKEGNTMLGSDGNRSSNYSLIDDRYSPGTDFIRGSGLDEIELFEMENQSYGSDNVKGVQLYTRAYKFGVNNISGSILLGTNNGNSIYTGYNMPLGEEVYDHFKVIETDPSTNQPWNQSDLSKTEVGVTISYVSSGTT